MVMKRRSWFLTTLVLALAGAASGCAGDEQQTQGAPSAREPSGSSASQALSTSGSQGAPVLCAPGDVPGFIDWAGRSTVDQRDVARRAIVAASRNEGVIQALISEVETVQWRDHSRALLGLAILGEMRSPSAGAFLLEFANRPLPQSGTVVFGGEIEEQTAQAMLQAKAVDGLAYLPSHQGDAAVLAIAVQHPSKIVRAEAINAFLWNNDDSRTARRLLAWHVREDERILIDRVRRGSGEGMDSFDAKVQAFIESHPEAVPPLPERLPEDGVDDRPTDQ
jgi:hypothetical protein